MKLSIRLSNAGLISVVGLIVALLLLADISVHRSSAPQATNTDRIVTRELVLVDSSGRTRARLAVDSSDAPSLRMYDKRGTQRATFRLNQDDIPSLRLYNEDGKVDSVLGYNLGTMDPALVFFDESGTGRLVNMPFAQALTSQIFHDADLYPYESRYFRHGWNMPYRWEETPPIREREIAPHILELGEHTFDE